MPSNKRVQTDKPYVTPVAPRFGGVRVSVPEDRPRPCQIARQPSCRSRFAGPGLPLTRRPFGRPQGPIPHACP